MTSHPPMACKCCRWNPDAESSLGRHHEVSAMRNSRGAPAGDWSGSAGPLQMRGSQRVRVLAIDALCSGREHAAQRGIHPGTACGIPGRHTTAIASGENATCRRSSRVVGSIRQELKTRCMRACAPDSRGDPGACWPEAKLRSAQQTRCRCAACLPIEHLHGVGSGQRCGTLRRPSSE